MINSDRPVLKTMQFRYVTPDGADLLAPLNRQLIVDEGHRNPMTVEELATRLKKWLSQEYQAVVFEEAEEVLGYALYKFEPDHVYLRQLFVLPQYRLKGIGRSAMDWLKTNSWQNIPKVRIEVLSGNVGAQKFWRSIGFENYLITMELEASPVNMLERP